MSIVLPLSQAQIDHIEALLAGSAPNYPAAYRYIADLLRSDPVIATDPAMERLIYFFPGAADVNENNATSVTNLFIRGLTRDGLAYDGLIDSNGMISDTRVVATGELIPIDQFMQRTSNAIAARLFRDILDNRGVSDLNSLFLNDIAVAIEFGQPRWVGSSIFLQ